MEEREREGLRERALGLLDRWRHQFQPLWGRHEIVSRFHELRGESQPPTFVVEGIWGSGKGRLLTHLRAGYRRRTWWWFGLELDVRVDLAQVGATGPEAALSAIRKQLRARRLVRRLITPVWTPRFALLEGALWRHRIKLGLARGNEDQLLDDAQWAAAAAAKGVAAAHGGGLPLVPLSRRAGIVRWVRVLWTRCGPTEASRWVRAYEREIANAEVDGGRDLYRAEQLERGLISAMAKDLAVATRRRRLALRKAIIFIDGYHLSETAGQSWIGDFASDLRSEGAKVMLVVSCRTQQMWSERLREELAEQAVAPSVEIHGLHELSIDVARRALARQRVPGELVDDLAQASLGHPLALRLLGTRFGAGPPPAQQAVRAMLKQLPQGDDPNDAWMREFCAIVAPSIVEGFGEELRWHLRAAAALRSFDRDLLALVLDDRFSELRFRELVATPLVREPRPSSLLPSGEAYRVRSFVREFLRREHAEPQAERRWHKRAAGHFGAEADAARDDENRQFELRAEALFHTFFVAEEPARADLVGTFLDAMGQGRLDRCAMLIDIAHEVGLQSPAWRARVATMAGSRYLKAHLYELAEPRFREARELVGEDPAQRDLRLRVGQALASCLRHEGRFESGWREIERVLAEATGNPVARFQATWTASLLAKDLGNLVQAEQLATDAEGQLGTLLANGVEAHLDVAIVLGIRHLPRKRAHLLRHRADIARRMGRYEPARQLLQRAQDAYREDPEPGAEALMRVVESHLLRMEGRASEAVELAERTLEELRRHAPANTRAERMAVRCVAQARLATTIPDTARPYFELLSEADPARHPVSACVSRYGIGELQRLAGSFEEAGASYRDAIAARNGEGGLFEHIYAELGLAELAREAGDPAGACDALDFVRGTVVLDAHPLVRFWLGLLSARAHAQTPRSRWRHTQRAAQSLREARDALAALAPNGDAQALAAVWERTDAALGGGGPFEPVPLLLP